MLSLYPLFPRPNGYPLRGSYSVQRYRTPEEHVHPCKGSRVYGERWIWCSTWWRRIQSHNQKVSKDIFRCP